MLCKFPQTLAKLRRQRGISQKKAAEELGISPALLSHYENGIRECGLDFLLRIAEYYSVSCDYLLGKSELRNPGIYEAEPEALAIDRILKTAKEHSEDVHNILSDIAEVEAYRMSRALCDTAARGDAFVYRLESSDYKNVCNGVTNCLYGKLAALGKEKKKLSHSVKESTEKVIEAAEDTIEKYL
jgi:transcriptional regulator with XRE-family HTH domain